MKLNITKKLIQIYIEWGGGGKRMDMRAGYNNLSWTGMFKIIKRVIYHER